MHKFKEELKLLIELFKGGITLNKTNWEHVQIAFIYQAIVVAIFGWFWFLPALWAGATLGCGVFIGREQAQAEAKVLKELGVKTYLQAETKGIDVTKEAGSFKYWTMDSLMDKWLPIVCVTAVSLVVTWVFGVV